MGFDVFTMPTTAIFLLLLTYAINLTPVLALPWPGPQPTAVYKADEWSPRPTSVSSPQDLFKRDSVDANVCGWYGGLQASPAACGAGSACVRDTVRGIIGCCATEGPCTTGVYTGCVDQNSVGWEPNAGIQANGIYTCGPSLVCNRNEFEGGYYQYSCGASSSAATIATTFAGQPSELSLQMVFTAVDFNIPITQSSTAISSLTSSLSSSTPTSTSTATASSTPTAIAEAHKSNTAAIVGGVVGGVAGLTAIAGAALFCFRRRRKANYKAYNPPKMISPDGSPRSTIRHDFSPPRQIVQGDVPHLPAEPPATASNTLGSPPPYASERPAGEMDPFVSEINDFSRSWTAVFSNQGARQSSSSWHDAIFGEGSRPGTEAGEVEGGLSIQAGYVPAHMRRNSSVYSSRSTRFNFGGAQNTRTVDLDVSRESIRSGESESVVISPASFSTPAAALYSVSLDDDNEDFLERTLSTRGRVVSANVRNEGWSPSGLNIPPKPGQAAAPDGRKRYSLSDTSSEGRALPVLSSRGSRPQKDRASMGSSRGGFGYGSVSVVSE